MWDLIKLIQGEIYSLNIFIISNNIKVLIKSSNLKAEVKIESMEISTIQLKK